jgi:hypothetical protein
LRNDNHGARRTKIRPLRGQKTHRQGLQQTKITMTNTKNKHDKFIRDAAAFLRHCRRTGTWDRDVILTTLVHDISGLDNDESCFLPRVSGYADREP